MDMSIALLWDESFLWALTAHKGLRALGVEPCIVSAADVRGGALEGHGVLFVPGGWASDKSAKLGPEGADAVRSFVRSGGSYLGICGGAGLALDDRGGLALTHVSRVPTAHRVPSFSGEIILKPTDAAHPIWRGIRRPYSFTAWWPGQFHIPADSGVRVLAEYDRPGRGFCTADLNASDVELYDDGYEKWEAGYGINLDPARLAGEPAIIEAEYGTGRVLLSYLHLETPGSRKGNRALANLLEYLKPQRQVCNKRGKASARKTCPVSPEAARASEEMYRAAREFISFGERNMLWYWRTPWLLQWRRGVRGVEYSMLYAMLGEIRGITDGRVNDMVVALEGDVLSFFEDAKRLLMKERRALMGGSMSTIKSTDPEVDRLREGLFSGSKRLGGRYKDILDRLDAVIYSSYNKGGADWV